MNSFSIFGFNDSIVQTIARLGFTEPTEIQAKTFRHILNGNDVIGQSKTGSGKTLAYLLPLLQRISTSGGLAMVLVPTRELVFQVEGVAQKFLNKSQRDKVVTVVGGASLKQQMRSLASKPNLIVSTPGRLIDHLSRGSISFETLNFLVLDEADRMLDMGFYPQIRQILLRVPKERQTVLFSATFSNEVKGLARELTKQPLEVSVGRESSTPATIEHQNLCVSMKEKNNVLVDELVDRSGSVLIFTKTKHKTDRLTKHLVGFGFDVDRIHGGRTLVQRTNAINAFKSGRIRILVATDIAARGLDIAQVGHVINFDLPQNVDDYVHRVGRTGRAGAKGEALSLVTPEDSKKWRAIQKLICNNKNAPRHDRQII